MTFLDEIEASIPALRRYAHGLLRDREAAEDLVQDCLERALSRRGQWRGDGPVRAWLYRILLNRFRDQRRSADALAHLVPVERMEEPSHSGGQERRLAIREIHDAMGRLPVDQRAALLLVAVEGLSLAEASDVLNVPQGTLASRLARGRAALRQMTGRGGDGPENSRRVTR